MAQSADDITKSKREALRAIMEDPTTMFSIEVNAWMHTADGRVEKIRGMGSAIASYEELDDIYDDVKELEEKHRIAFNKAMGIDERKQNRRPQQPKR